MGLNSGLRRSCDCPCHKVVLPHVIACPKCGSDGIEPTYCDDCDSDDHDTGSLLCPHTADSCGICGGYHDSFFACQDGFEYRELTDDEEAAENLTWD